MQEHDLSFVRVGAVDHKSARLVARIPPFPLVPDNDQKGTGARVAYRPTKPVGRWIMGPEIKVSADRDWVGAVTVDGLWASTEYEYRLLLPTLSNSHHPYFPRLQTFTTFPDPALSSPISPHATGESNSGGTHFTFAATSCVKPGFPYRGPSKKREIRGAKYLLNEVERQGVKFLLFLGDYIYADTPVYPGPKKEAYWTRYRQVFASPWMKALVEKIPMIAIWDDHESFNDWSESVALKHPERFPPAQTAYETYLGQANPAPSVGDTDSTSATMGEDEGGRGVHYYDFRYGDAAFFVWDTRSFRSANKAVDDDSKTMLGERQKVVFLDWLAKVNQTITWKFVVSSVPLMTLWSLTDDTWSAFQTERDALLDVMQYIPNVIVLSGDRHEFAAASIRTTITEFSTSPLSQFYLPIRTLSQSHNRGATGEDILLKYLPDGNSKFSTFEVDTRIANQPVVRVRVTIDGEEAWAVDVHGKQLDIPPPPKGIGSLGKSLLELLGFKVSLQVETKVFITVEAHHFFWNTQRRSWF
ncbi:Metallo-dependent phosphatase [Meredithblackwellia eburnea MCA 4105]